MDDMDGATHTPPDASMARLTPMVSIRTVFLVRQELSVGCTHDNIFSPGANFDNKASVYGPSHKGMYPPVRCLG